MILIPLGDDFAAIIDAADEALVGGFRWKLQRHGDLLYAHAWHRKLSLLMHRLVIGAGQGELVDHRNRNGLDNRRRNLRIATSSQNGGNRIADRRKAPKTSHYKGVYWDKSRSRWMAVIHVNGHSRSLGRFDVEDEAAAS
jgi:hypothetical protein